MPASVVPPAPSPTYRRATRARAEPSPSPYAGSDFPTLQAVQQVLGGRYRVERLVERGVLTDDYEATDLTLERRVVLKVLKEELDEEPAVRHLFEDAAHAAASLNHPNIVRTLDSGDDDGISYVVTELVDGTPLARVLDH